MSITLAQSTGPAYTRIYAYGAARGEKIVPNDDLVGPIDSSDEWIRQRTGIETRLARGRPARPSLEGPRRSNLLRRHRCNRVPLFDPAP